MTSVRATNIFCGFKATGTVYATRAEWLAARRTMLTASDCAAVLGFDPFKSAFSVWAEKKGVAMASALGVPFVEPDEEDTEDGKEAMRWGNILEEPVAQETAKRLRVRIRDHGRFTLFRRPEDDFGFPLGVTPDREIVSAGEIDPERLPGVDCICCEMRQPEHGRLAPVVASLRKEWLESGHLCPGVLEAKTFGAWADPEGDWNQDGPARHLAQLQIQMAVLGISWGVLAGLQGGQKLRYFTHDRDDAFLAWALPKLEAFWVHCVMRNNAPPVDGSKATDEALSRLYGGNGSSVELSPKGTRAVASLMLNAQARKRLEADDAIARQEIQAEMGDAEIAHVPSMSTNDSRRVIWRKVVPTKATACPSCKAQVKGPPSPYRRFVVPEG